MFKAKAVVLATGGIGKCVQDHVELLGVHRATATRWRSGAGADLIDMEFVQFHPTGMVWPPSVRGILVTEGVRGDGGTLRNSKGERFMFRYIPDFFRAETADNEDEADRWYEDKKNNRRTPDLLPRDEVARAINAEVKAGRGSPARRRLPRHRHAPLGRLHQAEACPSMYHQFKELADVDITKEPMEVGPTCHYIMGGVRVDADTTAATGLPGSSPPARCAGGMHGVEPPGRQLALRPPRVRPARRALRGGARAGRQGHADDRRAPGRGGDPGGAGARSSAKTGENPYAIQKDLQEVDAEPGRHHPDASRS